jgi:valyl-tRNA synthetase
MYFKNIENIKSIHHTIMPAFGSIQEDEISYRAGEYMILLVSLVRGYKSKNQFSLMLPADKVIFNTSHANAQTGHLIVDDLKKILVSNEVIFEDKESAEVDWYTETAIFDGEITKTFVEMNPNAVAGSKISSRIKQLVTDAKKEQGLKSKSQVKKVSVICSMDLEELIKSQYEKILYTTKSESLNIVVSKKFSGENLSVSIDI